MQTATEATQNNVMRHEYKELNLIDKALMQQVKEDGLAFWNLLDALGRSREVSLAKTKIEESVMWAVKALSA